MVIAYIVSSYNYDFSFFYFADRKQTFKSFFASGHNKKKWD